MIDQPNKGQICRKPRYYPNVTAPTAGYPPRLEETSRLWKLNEFCSALVVRRPVMATEKKILPMSDPMARVKFVDERHAFGFIEQV